MDKEQLAKKLSALFQDKDFVFKLAETKSDEEAIKLFAENDCELEPEKVKFVRDTLDSLLKGEIEISEEDLENISGGSGEVDYKKVLAVALGATIVLGGGALLVSNLKGAPPPQPPQPSFWGNIAQGAGQVGKAALPIAGAMAQVAAQPTYWQSFTGLFSKKQRMVNAGLQAAGTVVANMAGLPQQ